MCAAAVRGFRALLSTEIVAAVARRGPTATENAVIPVFTR